MSERKHLQFALLPTVHMASPLICKGWRDETRLMPCHGMGLIHSIRHDTSLI